MNVLRDLNQSIVLFNKSDRLVKNTESVFNLTDFVKSGLIILSFLVCLIIIPEIVQAQITYTISKSNNAPNPIASGQPFTYTITYSWSGGAPGTLYIVDNVPSTLDVLSTLPATVPVGNQVTFVLTGLTLPSGSGTVQINTRFTPGITCGGIKACNRAGITDNPNTGKFTYSNDDCVTSATPTNKWQFEKEWISGCAVDDEVTFRIKVINPSGSDIGGVNLTNVTLNDIIPPGAVILSVTGWPWNGITGTLLTPSPQTFGVSPWTQWYMAYVKLKFPTGFFTAGQTVINTAQLRFNTPCNPQFVTWTDTAKVTLCQGVTQGSLGKYLSLGLYFPNNPSWYPVFSPGCCGTYQMYYNNTGTLGQTNFVMEDQIPPQLDVNSIRTDVPAGNTPVTLNVYCWSGGTCGTVPCTTAVYSTAGTQYMTGLPPNICKVKWSYSGSIAVSQSINNGMDVCVRTTNYTNGAPVLTGQNIINTVTATATSLPTITVTHTKVVDATQPKVVSTKMFIGGCSNTCQVMPNGPFQPGNIVRFRMAVANIGNANATTCSINDLLPVGLSYIGNETYYYGTFNYMAYIYNPPCCSLTAVVPAPVGGSITKPTTGATNLTWTFPVLPGRCDGQVDYFLIDFDVKISDNPPAAPGQYLNTFSFAASNVPSFVSNPAYLTVNATAQLQSIKQVRKKGSGGPWGYSALILPGAMAEYQLTVKNTGNTALSNVCLLDIMPWVGDIKVLPAYSSRGSMFNLPYNPADGAFAITPTGFTAGYNLPLGSSQNPQRSTVCGGFCGVADPPGAVAGTFGAVPGTTYSYKISANSGVNLAPGGSLDIIVPAKVPTTGVKPQYNACNSFAVQAVPLGITNVCLSAESNPACIVVDSLLPCFRFEGLKLTCSGNDANGNWAYQFSLNITNLTGQTGFLQITPSVGTLTSVTPGSIPSGVPTTVTGNFIVPDSNGVACFNVVLYDQKKNKLCDSTICWDYLPCPDPCPCPFKMIIEKPTTAQASGNMIWINNLMSIVGTNIQKVKATVVKASVSQYCFFGGSTTYTPPVTIVSANWNPVTAVGFGTSEVTWTNMQCPPFVGKNIGLYLNIPTAPSKKCYQIVHICVRYTFTDCKCNTCDTLVCYDLLRKWLPFIDVSDWTGVVKSPVGKVKSNKSNEELQGNENPFIQINLTSPTKGKITITNPAEDDYTMGMTLQLVRLSTSPGIHPVSIQPDMSSWTAGVNGDDGITSTGVLEPGQILNFDVEYENTESFKQWVNNFFFEFTIKDYPDTLSGQLSVTSRTPGDVGGDLITDNNGTNIKNARTFALSFLNANTTKDSIAKLILKVKSGSILAVGPHLSEQEVPMNGYRTTGGNVTLLVGSPDNDAAVISAVPSGANINPIYVTLTNDDPSTIILDYQTQTASGDIITNGSIELTSPVSSVKPGGSDGGVTSISLSDAVPNPTDGSTTIRFELMNYESNIKLYVVDLKGSVVATLIDNSAMNAGNHEIKFNAENLTSGVYYYTIMTGNSTQTRKLVLIK